MSIPLSVTPGITWTEDMPLDEGNLNMTANPLIAIPNGAGIGPLQLDMPALSTALATSLRSRNFLPVSDFPPKSFIKGNGLLVESGASAINASGWIISPVGGPVNTTSIVGWPDNQSSYGIQINGSAFLSTVTFSTWLDSTIAGLLRDQQTVFSAWIYNGTAVPIRPRLIISVAGILDSAASINLISNTLAPGVQEIAPNTWGRVSWINPIIANIEKGVQFGLRFDSSLNGTSKLVQIAQVQLEKGTVVTAWVPGNSGTAFVLAAEKLPIVQSAQITYIATAGQSNAAGSDSTPLVNSSILGVYNHQTFSGGPNNPFGAALLTAVPMFETFRAPNQYETVCSSIARSISEILLTSGREDLVTFGVTAAVGGTGITAHLPGGAIMANLQAYHNAALALAVIENRTFASSAVCWIQGESDAANSMTQAIYLGHLSAIANHIFNNMGGAHMLVCQTVGYTGLGEGPALAHLQADEHPYIHMVTPVYFLQTGGNANANIHFDSTQTQKLGFYFGRAWTQLADGNPVSRIRIIRATQVGEYKLYIYFDVPKLPLVFDTATIPATANRGFSVTDDSGDVPISGVAIEGSTVAIDCSRAFVGLPTVRYALRYNSTGWVQGASGNLRDSTDEYAWINAIKVPLPHWCPHFKLAASIKTIGGPLVEIPEVSAIEHWVFGGTSASLTGVKHSLVAVPVAGVTPTYNAQAVLLPLGVVGTSYLNGLVLPFADRSDWTGVMVFRRRAVAPGDYGLILGSCDVTTYAGNAGAGLLDFGVAPVVLDITVRAQGPGGSPGAGNVSVGRPYSDGSAGLGDFVFAAFTSRDNFVAGRIGAGTLLEDSVNSRTPASRSIALGNAYVPYSNCTPGLEVSELIIWDRALNALEISGVKTRCVARQALKGITIF